MSAHLDIVVVTYNSAAVVRDFLHGVPVSANVIVVDNQSSDDTVVLARAASANVIEVGENIGYGRACNIGAAAGEAPFLLFANPDLRLQPGTIEFLVQAASTYPEAAFNPCIYSGSRRRFKGRSRLIPASEHWRGSAPDKDCIVPVLHGSCIFIRRKHFDMVGGFDPNIFLFHEDDDLSLRLRHAGIELRLAAKALIDHAEGNSSPRSSDSGWIKGKAMGRSLVYVMNKHRLPLNIRAERRRTWIKLLLPHVFLNKARRSKLRGFLHGLNGDPQDRVEASPDAIRS